MRLHNFLPSRRWPHFLRLISIVSYWTQCETHKPEDYRWAEVITVRFTCVTHRLPVAEISRRCHNNYMQFTAAGHPSLQMTPNSLWITPCPTQGAGSSHTRHYLRLDGHRIVIQLANDKILPLVWSRNCVVVKQNRYRLNGPGIEFRWGRDFLQLSRPALGPTQPPIQGVLGLSQG